MALFRTDSVVLCHSNLEVAKRWWTDAFDCKQSKVPEDWNNHLPSDLALKLPGYEEPTILLCDRAEVQQAGFTPPTGTPVIFSDKLKKAYEYLFGRGVSPGPIQDGGDTQFFEIRDPEGNTIEICKEP